MFYCDKCGCTDCCERTDLIGEPILCDACYVIELYGCDCDHCLESYYEGDKLRCNLDICQPKYDF